MDPIVANQAANKAIKILSKRGRVGDVKPGKEYTFDGNMEGAEIYPIDILGANYARISNDTPDLTKVSQMNVRFGEALENPDPSAWTVEDMNLGGFTVSSIVVDEAVFAFVNTVDEEAIPKGLYVGIMNQEPLAFTSLIKFAETIHPIDPKFIPGAVLPVVDLTGCTSGEAITDTALITKLDTYAETVPAFLGKVAVSNVESDNTFAVHILISSGTVNGGFAMFVGMQGDVAVTLMKEGEDWMYQG